MIDYIFPITIIAYCEKAMMCQYNNNKKNNNNNNSIINAPTYKQYKILSSLSPPITTILTLTSRDPLNCCWIPIPAVPVTIFSTKICSDVYTSIFIYVHLYFHK